MPEDNESSYTAMPLNTDWLDGAPDELRHMAEELIGLFNESVMFIGNANEAIKATEGDYDKAPKFAIEGALLLGFAESVFTAVLKIAAIESIKHAHGFETGMDMDILQGIGRSLLGPFLLSGIRFGQHHPDAFMGGVEANDLSSAVEAVLRGLATDQSPEGDDQQ